MRYEGFHADAVLPIKRGQKVVIPAGTTVRSMGSKGVYVTKRAQTVFVRGVMNGQSVSNYYALNDRQHHGPLKAAGFDFSVIRAMRDAGDPEYYRGFVPISNPSITWAGTGGYWCDADINDILEANGLGEKVAA